MPENERTPKAERVIPEELTPIALILGMIGFTDEQKKELIQILTKTPENVSRWLESGKWDIIKEGLRQIREDLASGMEAKIDPNFIHGNARKAFATLICLGCHLLSSDQTNSNTDNTKIPYLFKGKLYHLDLLDKNLGHFAFRMASNLYQASQGLGRGQFDPANTTGVISSLEIF